MTPVYLYQVLHTLGYRLRMTEAHAALLDHWSRTLFGRSYTPDLKKLEACIGTMLEAECRPRDLSVFVRLSIDPQGHETLTTEGLSLYHGYALRSLSPEAAVVTYEIPHPEAPTSAREAAAALAQIEAECSGARIAIRCDSCGLLHTTDNAPLFAVRGKQLFATTAETSVEGRLVLEAARRAGLTMTGRPATHDALGVYDEVFGFDHRGVTAVSRCQGHPYMAIFAERIAREAEGLFI